MIPSILRAAIAAFIVAAPAVASAATLDTIKSRGVLNCGANGQLLGFGLPDAQEPGPGLTWTIAAPWQPRSSMTPPK